MGRMSRIVLLACQGSIWSCNRTRPSRIQCVRVLRGILRMQGWEHVSNATLTAMSAPTLPRNALPVQTASSATSTNTAKISAHLLMSATQPVLFANTQLKIPLTISDAPRPSIETSTRTPVWAFQSLSVRPTINQPACAHLASCPTISTKEPVMLVPT